MSVLKTVVGTLIVTGILTLYLQSVGIISFSSDSKPDKITVKSDSTAYWAYMEAIDSLSYIKTRLDSFETRARAVRWAPKREIVQPVTVAANDSGRIIDSLVAVIDSLLGTEYSRDTTLVVGDSVATIDMHTKFRFWPVPAFSDVVKWNMHKVLVKEVRTETIIDRTRKISLGVGVGYGLHGPDVHIGIYYQLWGIK